MQSQRVERVALAIRKFVFCFTVSSSLSSFLRLLSNTKRFAWSRKKPFITRNDDLAVCYPLKIQGIPRNIFLRTYDGDLHIFYEIFWRSVYSLPSRIFSEARTIVDIGAHAGIATLFFKIQSPKAKVYAVEADEKNYNVLLQNLHPEIENREVIPIHGALTDRNEPIYLQRSQLGYNTSLSDSNTGFAVKGFRMEQLLRDYDITTIDILKIDIEGAEAFLFSSETSWLRNVRNILIELHSDMNAKQFEQAALLYDFRIEKRISKNEIIYWAYKPSLEV